VGKGTTFTLYLPVTAARGAEPQKALDRSISEAVPDIGPGHHIYYIDDDESLVILVKRILERRGYVVTGFLDGRVAVDHLRRDPYACELVVTDYNMPQLSGLDVARAVREIREDLPVAVVSGFIDERLLSQAPDAGVLELLVKAVDATEFADGVDRIMRGIVGNTAPGTST